MGTQSNKSGKSTISGVTDQALAALVGFLKVAREHAEAAQIAAMDLNFEKAAMAFDTVRYYIDRPEKLLGDMRTKHGELAELLEVARRNAQDIFSASGLSASLSKQRTGPTDYHLDGMNVQSKFCNGVTNTISAVQKHLAKYPDFVSQKGEYVVPKDLHAVASRIAAGDIEGINSSTVNAVKERIAELEALTGKSFAEIVKPAAYDYSEVQLGAVDKTLDGQESELAQKHENRVDEALSTHGPNLADGLKIAATAGAIAGGVTFVRVVYRKHKEGRNIFRGQLTAGDWKELGLEVSKDAAVGGVTGLALYGMTNFAGLAAPLAGAMVSLTKGLVPLVQAYRRGDSTMEELLDNGSLLSVQVGMVAAAAFVGQAVIPVPILGALVGSMAAKTLGELLEDHVEGSKKALELRLIKYQSELGHKERIVLGAYMARYDELGLMTEAAFDMALNAQVLMASASLAISYGVDTSEVVRTITDVDALMMS